jgi:tRNA threonylcarbamoyladenosine biosynthesis protein TsaE
MEYLVSNETETRNVAQKILKNIISENSSGPVFVGLVGELGAGKTTFMKGVAEFFGVTQHVSSPTFVIQKIYEIGEDNRQKENHNFKKIIHMDLYRLEDEKSLPAIKWEEYKNDKSNILFVEWPNQIWKDFPEEMIEIKIEHEGGDKRKIIY